MTDVNVAIDLSDSPADWVVVDRLTRGIPVDATTEERHIAADILHGRGVPLVTIAEMVGVTERSVNRWYPAAPREPITCGTRSGYRRHLRRRETPCETCKAANAAYDRRRGLGDAS